MSYRKIFVEEKPDTLILFNTSKFFHHVSIAQLVEHRSVKPIVVGSSPTGYVNDLTVINTKTIRKDVYHNEPNRMVKRKNKKKS